MLVDPESKRTFSGRLELMPLTLAATRTVVGIASSFGFPSIVLSLLPRSWVSAIGSVLKSSFVNRSTAVETVFPKDCLSSLGSFLLTDVSTVP